MMPAISKRKVKWWWESAQKWRWEQSMYRSKIMTCADVDRGSSIFYRRHLWMSTCLSFEFCNRTIYFFYLFKHKKIHWDGNELCWWSTSTCHVIYDRIKWNVGSLGILQNINECLLIFELFASKPNASFTWIFILRVSIVFVSLTSITGVFPSKDL